MLKRLLHQASRLVTGSRIHTVSTHSHVCSTDWPAQVLQVSSLLDFFLASSDLRSSNKQSDQNFVGYLEHYRKPETLAMYQRLLDDLWSVEQLGNEVRINDYGCWCGAVALLMRHYGSKVVGFDVVDDSVQQARALGQFSCVESLEFESAGAFHGSPESFPADLCVVMDVLCSANPDEHLRILSSLVRATSRGGLIFISDANNLRDATSVKLLQERWRG